MLERLDAAVTAALQPLQAAMEGKAAAEVVQPLAQVRLNRALRNNFTFWGNIQSLAVATVPLREGVVLK